MDATYKTTNYSIPLFFLCVKTNVNYTIVAEFVIQSENTEHTFEQLIIKSWTPSWNPKFITDYSDAKMSAINMLSQKLNCICVNSIGNRHGKGGLKTKSMARW